MKETTSKQFPITGYDEAPARKILKRFNNTVEEIEATERLAGRKKRVWRLARLTGIEWLDTWF